MRCITLTETANGNTLQASEDVAACAPNQLVLVSYQEFLALPRSPFVMSVEDGAALSGMIILVWVGAMIFRWFIRTLQDRGE